MAIYLLTFLLPSLDAGRAAAPPRSHAEARGAYRRALALVHDDAERRLLERRLAELGRAAGPARQ
jgi:predicted RNA polymerase sigma factor